MPTRNVSLTAELDRFVASKIEAGRYENASEREFEVKLAALRTAIDEGNASGIAKGNAFARIRKSLKLPAQAR